MEKPSFATRFMTKFVEVVGAGAATAITGYMIAHLGGFLSSPATTTSLPSMIPATVQTSPPVQSAPTATVVTKAPRTPSTSTTAAKPVDKANDQPVASTDDNAAPPATTPTAQPPRATASAPQAAPSRKRGTTDATTAESKPRDRAAEATPAVESKPDAKPREAVERDMEAVEAQVRAALANADAHRPASSESSRQSNPVPKVQPVAVQPPPSTESPPAAVAAVPRATDPPPPVMLQPPTQSEPLTPVEIKSRPIADVNSMPAPTPASQQTAQQEDKGLFSMFKKIPDMLRPAADPPRADPPRPPMPVGADAQ